MNQLNSSVKKVRGNPFQTGDEFYVRMVIQSDMLRAAANIMKTTQNQWQKPRN